jgi:hypothetical protein
MPTLTPVLDITAAETRELDALALIAQIEDAKAKQADLAVIEKAARDQLAALLDFGSHKIGSHTVIVNAPLRLTDKAGFMAAYPESEFGHFYTSTINTKAVDAVLGDAAKAFKTASSIVCSIR